MRRSRSIVLAAAAVLGLAVGCGGGEHGTTGSLAPEAGRDSSAAAPARERAARKVAPSRCPTGVPGCRTTRGRIVYVERVDPDGDGDAHFVVADPQGITLPGLTAIDVRKGLRPEPLPGPGDLLSAAGPVQTGSYGQSQIHALELHVGR